MIELEIIIQGYQVNDYLYKNKDEEDAEMKKLKLETLKNISATILEITEKEMSRE